jgi:hypothetical protein
MLTVYLLFENTEGIHSVYKILLWITYLHPILCKFLTIATSIAQVVCGFLAKLIFPLIILFFIIIESLYVLVSFLTNN